MMDDYLKFPPSFCLFFEKKVSKEEEEKSKEAKCHNQVGVRVLQCNRGREKKTKKKRNL